VNHPRPRYRVELVPAAERQLRKLDRQVARRVLFELDLLQAEPRPLGCRAMVGQQDRWRIRVRGARDYRIGYEIRDDQLLVLVVMGGAQAQQRIADDLARLDGSLADGLDPDENWDDVW